MAGRGLMLQPTPEFRNLIYGLESTDLWRHPLMPPNWFLQLWRGQGDHGGISQGLRFWRQLREIPERYCGGQWRRPVQKGPVLTEWYESRSLMIAKPDWA